MINLVVPILIDWMIKLFSKDACNFVFTFSIAINKNLTLKLNQIMKDAIEFYLQL